MPKFDEGIEAQLKQIVVNTEYSTAETNQAPLMDDYRSYLDLFDAERSEKDYDWMSDISLPEFATHMLTQSAMDVDQYFSQRDFVECYIQDNRKEAKDAAEASKELSTEEICTTFINTLELKTSTTFTVKFGLNAGGSLKLVT